MFPWLWVCGSAVVSVVVAHELDQEFGLGRVLRAVLVLFIFFGSVTVIDRYIVDIPSLKIPRMLTYQEELEEEVSQDLIYGVLKKRNQQAFDKVLRLLYSLRYENADEQAVMRSVNKILTQTFEAALYRASDSALVGYLDYKLQEMADLAEYHDGFCYGSLWDEGEDVTQGGELSEETRVLFREVFIQVMDHSVGGDKLPSEVMYDQAMTSVNETMYARFGEEIRIFFEPEIYVRDSENRARYCVIMRGYYEAILDEPPAQAGLIVRWLNRPRKDRA
ncbi:hypothetical protein [Desulfoluna sp.]|uniref:hypothetical protein n=1 Tax=Desulfoluna sp. TaxID=2045199 RepID=UPI002607472F|nr:hypothetical protein [Desulfoluna sp.]